MTWRPANTSKDLPDFDEGGNLPVGDYAPSMADLKARLVERFSSETRALIFQGWLKLQYEALQAGANAAADVLLNGSFTTAKTNPNDLDLVAGIPTECNTSKEFMSLSPLFRGKESIQKYNCDAYCFPLLPENHPYYESLTVNFREYWLKWFGTSRGMHPKGRVWTTLGAEQ
jgi:hypothetical protein